MSFKFSHQYLGLGKLINEVIEIDFTEMVILGYSWGKYSDQLIKKNCPNWNGFKGRRKDEMLASYILISYYRYTCQGGVSTANWELPWVPIHTNTAHLPTVTTLSSREFSGNARPCYCCQYTTRRTKPPEKQLQFNFNRRFSAFFLFACACILFVQKKVDIF